MSRWAWGALVVVIAAGAVNGWYSYRLQAHHLPGLSEPDVKPIVMIISIVPTFLFLAAAVVRRRSVGMQLSVAIAAVLVAAIRIYVIRFESSNEWTHGTGLFAAVAWMVGMGVAVGIMIEVMVAIAIQYAQTQRRSVTKTLPPN